MSRDAANSIFAIGQIGGGRISIGPRPVLGAFRRWLDVLRDAGVTHVVSLISQEEAARFSLEGEGRGLDNFGIGFTQFHVDDYDTPDAEAFDGLVRDLQARLADDAHLFIHCAGGIGRSGTLAACLLVANGMDADMAMQLVSQKRGVSSPETEGQRTFVRGFRP